MFANRLRSSGAAASSRRAAGHVARADHEVGVAAAAAISAGSCRGSCERSASIWQTTSTGSSIARCKPSMYDTAEAASAGAMQHLDAPGILRAPARRRPRRCRPATGRRRPARGRRRAASDSLDQHREVLPLVVGRDDDQRLHAASSARPSNRSDEICSDTSPTRNITTLSRISSTDEFVTCDCVTIVHSRVGRAERRTPPR